MHVCLCQVCCTKTKYLDVNGEFSQIKRKEKIDKQVSEGVSEGVCDEDADWFEPNEEKCGGLHSDRCGYAR